MNLVGVAALFLSAESLVQTADAQNCPDDAERAEAFFLVTCGLDGGVLSRKRRTHEVATDYIPAAVSKQHQKSRGLQLLGDDLDEFESDMFIEFFNIDDDFEPFSDQENNAIGYILADSYNTVFGCAEEAFVNNVEPEEREIVDFEDDTMPPVTPAPVSNAPVTYAPVANAPFTPAPASAAPLTLPPPAPIIPARKRNLQRVKQHRSLLNRFRANGRCRGCAGFLRLFNDIRARRRTQVTEDFNMLVFEALTNAGFTGFDSVRATNGFPFLDCDGDGIYEIDRVLEEETCAPSPSPGKKGGKKGSSSSGSGSTKTSKKGRSEDTLRRLRNGQMI